MILRCSLWLMRIPLAYLLAYNFGKENLYSPGWAGSRPYDLNGYFLSGRWKKKAIVLYEEQKTAKELRQAELATAESSDGE